jgi:hypothetical protein
VKKTLDLVVLLFLFLFLCPVFAVAGNSPDLRLKADLSLNYTSQYISNPTKGKTVYNKPDFQNWLKISLEPVGIYAKLGLFYSPKGGLNSDKGDEILYNFGINRKLLEEKVTIDIGYFYDNLQNLTKSKGDYHALYLNAVYGRDDEVFSSYSSLEVDFVRESVRFFYRNGGRVKVKLPDEFLLKKLFFDASFTGHSGWQGMKPAFISSKKISIFTKFKFWNEELIPQINFQKGDKKFTENKIWGNLCISVPLLQ